jgi:hypothetical protein
VVASNAKIAGEIEATSGKFTGEIEATSGKMNSITATDLTVKSGTFKGVINADGGIQMGVRTSNSTTINLNSDDSFLLITGADRSRTIKLPELPIKGQMITIKNIAGGTATLDGNGKDIILGYDSSETVYITGGRSVQLIYSGAGYNWCVIDKFDY